MNSTNRGVKEPLTLAIRFCATVQQEFAVSHEVFHGLNDVGLQSHISLVFYKWNSMYIFNIGPYNAL